VVGPYYFLYTTAVVGIGFNRTGSVQIFTRWGGGGWGVGGLVCVSVARVKDGIVGE
jgi:hypothetical protein